MGDGKKTLGARWAKKVVEVHDTYEFTSKKVSNNSSVYLICISIMHYSIIALLYCVVLLYHCNVVLLCHCVHFLFMLCIVYDLKKKAKQLCTDDLVRRAKGLWLLGSLIPFLSLS